MHNVAIVYKKWWQGWPKYGYMEWRYDINVNVDSRI